MKTEKDKLYNRKKVNKETIKCYCLMLESDILDFPRKKSFDDYFSKSR